jgi:hypothetical protein
VTDRGRKEEGGKRGKEERWERRIEGGMRSKEGAKRGEEREGEGGRRRKGRDRERGERQGEGRGERLTVLRFILPSRWLDVYFYSRTRREPEDIPNLQGVTPLLPPFPSCPSLFPLSLLPLSSPLSFPLSSLLSPSSLLSFSLLSSSPSPPLPSPLPSLLPPNLCRLIGETLGKSRHRELTYNQVPEFFFGGIKIF